MPKRSMMMVLLVVALAAAVIVAWVGPAQERPPQGLQAPPVTAELDPAPSARAEPASAAGFGHPETISQATPPSSPQATVVDEARPAMVAAAGQEAEHVGPVQDPLDHPDNPFEYGRTPAIPSSENPQVASVAQALREGTHPERLSPVHQATAFDLVAYEADPESYLSLIEPGRAFQSAQPGPEVPRLRALGPTQVRLRQGERVALRVQAQPGHPVSFTSFDLGIFAENMLTSITVAADAQGVAEVHLLGSAGTIGEIRILSSSPSSAGQVRYIAVIERDGGLDADPRQESERHG